MRLAVDKFTVMALELLEELLDCNVQLLRLRPESS